MPAKKVAAKTIPRGSRRTNAPDGGPPVDRPIVRRQNSPTKTGAVIKDGWGDPYVRISKRNAEMLEMTDWEDWDDEELRKGQRKVDGKFVGSAPAIIPRGAYEELLRRTIDTCFEQIRTNMPQLINSLTEMAADPDIEAKDRIKIVGMFMDRVFGKPVERKQLAIAEGGPAKWAAALDIAIVSDEADG